MTTRYKIRQNLISIGDDFWIENGEGKRVFKVDGKILRIRKTLVFEDLNGKPLCTIKERLLTIRDTMTITEPDGKQLAVIKKALLTPLRDRWSVNVKNGPDLDVQGNILDHEYSIKQGWNKVAEVSKKWFSLTDSPSVSPPRSEGRGPDGAGTIPQCRTRSGLRRASVPRSSSSSRVRLPTSS